MKSAMGKRTRIEEAITSAVLKLCERKEEKKERR